MDLGLKPATKMTAMERYLLRLHHTQCIFFMGVKTNTDDNVTLVLPVRSVQGENINKAGTGTAQNTAFTEGINETIPNMYTSETHFLGRAVDLHSGNLTDLQVSYKAYSNLTLLIHNPNSNTCATTNPRSHNQLTLLSYCPPNIVQAL